MHLSVIVPVHNGAASLDQCLAALTASDRFPDEIVVVDDSSSDGSAEIAHYYGVSVVTLAEGPYGPATARNRGVEAATGDILVFIDADVAVHRDTLSRIEQTMVGDPDLAAVFGSYDDQPSMPGLVSRYKNLFHHYVHQHGQREASTFWAGCGAIRHEVFAELGEFDTRYARPSIEDIALGGKMRSAGYRIRLDRDIQATHLKRWTLLGLLRTDICQRAVPWAQLILNNGQMPRDLNLDIVGRVGAVIAWILVVLVGLSPWFAGAWIGVLFALLVSLLLHHGLYGFFVRHGGMRFAAGAVTLHMLYLLYSSATFASVLAMHRIRRWARVIRHLMYEHRLLCILLVVTLLKGWLWGSVVPIWQAYDEDQHFGYVQEIVRQRTLAVSPPASVPLERQLLWDMVDPFRISGQREPYDLSPEGVSSLQIAKSQLGAPTARADNVPPIWFRDFTDQHPPLYYAALVPLYYLGSQQNLLVRIALLRMGTTCLAVAAIICSYGTARALWPEQLGRGIAVATLVSFHPMFTFATSVVNNAALEVVCWAALTWLVVRVRVYGMTRRRGWLLGFVLASGLLTRSSYLASLPLVGWLFLHETVQRRDHSHWSLWLPVIGLPLVLSGWWYAGFVSGFGERLVTVYSSTQEPTRDLSLLSYLRTYPWLTRYRPFLRQWWGWFGWGDTFYAPAMYVLLEGTVGAACVGWLALGYHEWRKRASSGDGLALVIGVVTTASLVAFFTALDYRMARNGGWFKIQGRYFLAGLAGQLTALVVGWTRLGGRLLLLILSVGMLVLNAYALTGVIIPRYYGRQIIVRHTPVGIPVSLAPGHSVTRSFQSHRRPPSRLDVWLTADDGTRHPQVQYTLYADEVVVTQGTIAPTKMTMPYPTTLEMPRLNISADTYTLVLEGESASVSLASDHSLALSAYWSVRATQIPARIAAVQTPGYSLFSVAALAVATLAVVTYYGWACWVSGLLSSGPGSDHRVP